MGVILRDVAFIQDLVRNPAGEREIRRYDGVLPGDPVFRDPGIMIIVPLPQDTVIQRMVGQLQTQGLQGIVLILVRRQEAHIDVSRTDIRPRGDLRIQGADCQGHILNRIGIRHFLSQDDHSMLHAAQVGPPGVREFRLRVRAADGEQQRRQFQKCLHRVQGFVHGKSREGYPC